MSRVRIQSLFGSCCLAVAGVLSVPATALAANVTDSFELDGNVLQTGAKPDWSIVNFAPIVAPLLAKTGVVADPAPKTIFTTGGSKDDLDITGWKYKDGSVPDKDNIVNAYTAAYNINNDLVIYAGAERFDNSGDANMGFWFFKNNISLNPNGSFNGQHSVGDTLVLANFSGGGTSVTIEVLKWVGSGGNVNGTLQRIAGAVDGAPAKCGAVGTPEEFCGITNPAAGEQPPWPFQNKDGNNFFQVANMLELGINITKVFQSTGDGSTPCFSAFMAETRSSSQVGAQLKDFVLKNFPVCGIAVSKQCKNPVLAGASTIGYTVEGQVDNTGFGTVTNLQLSDSPRPLGAVSYYGCSGGLPTGNPIGFSGTLNALASVCYRSSFTTTVNAEDDVITASATAGGATVTAQAGADCPPLQLSPELSVTKNCVPSLAAVSPYLAVQINVDGSVCNVVKTGSTTISGVTVNDVDMGGSSHLLALSKNTLAVGECATFTGSYFPSFATNRLSPLTSTFVPGLAKFSDTVTATGTAPFSTVTPQTATANCTLCPTCTIAGDQCTGESCPVTTGKTQTKQLIRTTK